VNVAEGVVVGFVVVSVVVLAKILKIIIN